MAGRALINSCSEHAQLGNCHASAGDCFAVSSKYVARVYDTEVDMFMCAFGTALPPAVRAPPAFNRDYWACVMQGWWLSVWISRREMRFGDPAGRQQRHTPNRRHLSAWLHHLLRWSCWRQERRSCLYWRASTEVQLFITVSLLNLQKLILLQGCK